MTWFGRGRPVGAFGLRRPPLGPSWKPIGHEASSKRSFDSAEGQLRQTGGVFASLLQTQRIFEGYTVAQGQGLLEAVE